jgi:putative solute:sodium symporter small subunit
MPVEPNAEGDVLRGFWRRHVRLVGVLTGVWGVAGLVAPMLAGWTRNPAAGLSSTLWITAEALPVVFVVIAWIYARRADALDAEFDAARR